MKDEVTKTHEWPQVIDGAQFSPDGGSFKTPASLCVTLEDALRNTFPINKVPDNLIQLLTTVQASGVQFTRDLHTFAAAMRDACGQKEPAKAVTHMGFGPPTQLIGSLCQEDGVLSASINDVDCPACRQFFYASADRG